MRWTKPMGISKVEYDLDGKGLMSTIGDTTLSLSGLNLATTYSIKLRSTTGSPCMFTDTTIQVKTNACSNIEYTIDFDNRVCMGTQMSVTVLDLYKAKYSISYNGGTYIQDTMYMFTPTISDSLRI